MQPKGAQDQWWQQRELDHYRDTSNCEYSTARRKNEKYYCNMTLMPIWYCEVKRVQPLGHHMGVFAVIIYQSILLNRAKSSEEL